MSSNLDGLAANAPDVEADIEPSRLFNAGLAPVPPSRRKWSMPGFAALWIGDWRTAGPAGLLGECETARRRQRSAFSRAALQRCLVHRFAVALTVYLAFRKVAPKL
jgi:hypothetical protein